MDSKSVAKRPQLSLWQAFARSRIVDDSGKSQTDGLVMSAVGASPATPTPLPSFGDRYRVERELGRGGMATVYLCLDTEIDRRVAIKLLNPELAAAVGGDRFHR